MTSGLRMRLIGNVARTPELRRVNLAFLGYSISEHGTWLAMAFYALQRGGPAEVGIVVAAQLLPGVVLTPFSSYAGDRFRPQRALAAGYLVQCAAMGATALAMTSGAGFATYLFGAVAATAVSFTRPVMGTLLPTVTHDPRDLVAANVVVGLIEQSGLFLGPVLAGVVLAIGSPALVFAFGAALTGIGCLAVALLRTDDLALAAPSQHAVVTQMIAGFVTLKGSPTLSLLLAFVATAGLLRGVGDVTFVTLADQRLHAGGGASGLLAMAYGVGGLTAAAAMTRLARSSSATGRLLVAGLVGGAAMAALAIASSYVSAATAFALLGAGDALVMLTATITVQRVAPTDVLARIFGIVEGIQMGFIAAGSYLVATLTDSLSLGAAFVTMAATVTALVLLATLQLHRHGEAAPPVEEDIVARLLADAVFAPLPAPTIERLARDAIRVHFEPGMRIITEGEVGDRYFLVVEGSVEITVRSTHVRLLGPGSSFGEIALLRDVPRTATVTAHSHVDLLAVGRDAFLSAVTGHPRSFVAASAVADDWLDQA